MHVISSPVTYLKCTGVDAYLEEDEEAPPAAPQWAQEEASTQAEFRLGSRHSFVAFASDLKLFGHVNTTFADCLAKLKWELRFA